MGVAMAMLWVASTHSFVLPFGEAYGDAYSPEAGVVAMVVAVKAAVAKAVAAKAVAAPVQLAQMWQDDAVIPMHQSTVHV
jgi:hypothetical protein